jgi:hypothetical protein
MEKEPQYAICHYLVLCVYQLTAAERGQQCWAGCIPVACICMSCSILCVHHIFNIGFTLPASSERDNTVRWFFRPFHNVYKSDLGSEILLVLVENSPRQAQFYVYRSAYSSFTAKSSWRFLLIRLNALSVFSVHAEILFPHSESTLYK